MERGLGDGWGGGNDVCMCERETRGREWCVCLESD